jgi:hypothetical protein
MKNPHCFDVAINRRNNFIPYVKQVSLVCHRKSMILRQCVIRKPPMALNYLFIYQSVFIGHASLAFFQPFGSIFLQLEAGFLTDTQKMAQLLKKSISSLKYTIHT